MKKSSTVKTKVEYFERKEIDRAFKFCGAMCERAQELMFKQMCDCSEKSRDSMELGKLLKCYSIYWQPSF